MNLIKLHDTFDCEQHSGVVFQENTRENEKNFLNVFLNPFAFFAVFHDCFSHLSKINIHRMCGALQSR